jgi:hypothetical protein
MLSYMKRFGFLVFILMLVLSMSAAYGGFQNPGEKFGKPGVASGEFAIAQASGKTKNPSKIWVKVTSSPSQSVQGAYSVVCSRGFGAGSKNGSIGGGTPLLRRLPLPTRNPDSCIVAANAQLQNSGGTVRVNLFVKH